MSTSYYQPSGRVSLAAYPFAVLYACAIPLGAWIHAWLATHLPPILNVFLAFGHCLFLGWLVRQVAQKGQVRNLTWIGRAGNLFALLGWYWQWAAWVALKTMPGDARFVDAGLLLHYLSLGADPSAIGRFAIAQLQASTGLIAGAGLLALWLLELGMYLLLPPVMGRMLAEKPYCELTRQWATKIGVTVEFAPVDAAAIVPILEGDPRQVHSVLAPLGGTNSLRFARAVLYRCAGSDSYLSLANVTRTRGSSGNIKEREEPVLEFLRLPGIDPDDLLRAWTPDAAVQGMGAGEDMDAGDTGGSAPVAVELESALAHLQAERFEEALAGAAPGTRSDQLAVRTDANRICALSCSRLGRWPEALGYWRALAEDEPTAHNALQVATTSVMAGELDEGIRAVELARDRNEESGEMPGLSILTGFVTALTQTGHLREAMPYVDGIRQAYLSAGTTDPTLLFTAGMPPFSVFLEKSLPVVRAALDAQKARRWYASMEARLDESGQAELDAWLEHAFDSAAGQGQHS